MKRVRSGSNSALLARCPPAWPLPGPNPPRRLVPCLETLTSGLTYALGSALRQLPVVEERADLSAGADEMDSGVESSRPER